MIPDWARQAGHVRREREYPSDSEPHSRHRGRPGMKFKVETEFPNRTFSNYTERFMTRSEDHWDLLLWILIRGLYIPFPLPLSMDGGSPWGRVVTVSPPVTRSQSTCSPRGRSWRVGEVTCGWLGRLSLVLLGVAKVGSGQLWYWAWGCSSIFKLGLWNLKINI